MVDIINTCSGLFQLILVFIFSLMLVFPLCVVVEVLHEINKKK